MPGALAAGVDTGAVWAAVIPVCASIIGGAIAMAWRLGSLDRTVKDMSQDMRDTTARLARLESQVKSRNYGRRATDWGRGDDRQTGGTDAPN